ncbi:MAG: tetratricopeptide repeat protein [Myxococcales bacterium]|nr:tetratricopeptide repeat protein [Myxococcales bacterium]
MCIFDGDFDRALKFADGAAVEAEKFGFTDLLAKGVFFQGDVAQHRGELMEAAERLQVAKGLQEQLGDNAALARTLTSLGFLAKRNANLGQAWAWLEMARETSRLIRDSRSEAYCFRGLAAIARIWGDFETSLSMTTKARDLYERSGNRFGAATCINGLGEICRAQGDLSAAETYYRQARTLYREVSPRSGWVPQINLCLVLLARGNYVDALAELDSLQLLCEQQGLRWLEASVNALRLPGLADLGDWVRFDECFQSLTELLAETGSKEPDDAWAIQLAGQIALNKGRAQRARHVLTEALRLWHALGKAQEVSQTEALLASVPA